MKPLSCVIALTLFLQFIQSKNDLLIISDRLVFIGSNILYSIGYWNIGKKSYRYISSVCVC